MTLYLLSFFAKVCVRVKIFSSHSKHLPRKYSVRKLVPITSCLQSYFLLEGDRSKDSFTHLPHSPPQMNFVKLFRERMMMMILRSIYNTKICVKQIKDKEKIM